MTAEEQGRWVSDFAEWMPKGRQLAKLGTGWSRENTADMERGLRLLAAWPFCEDYCEKAAHFGDYDRRAYRLPAYIDKVTEELTTGLTIKNVDGRQVVQVSPSVPLRRRGRPTKEEAAARLRGEQIIIHGDDAGAKKNKAVAKLLGMDVVVTGEHPREKNNAELAQERAAKKAEFERRNPSLFPDADDGRNSEVQAVPAPLSMSEIYQDRIENDRLRLSDIAWLCSKDLQERIALVRNQRTAFGDAAQTAKVLAERGAAQEEIALYAKQAEEAREAFEGTYTTVDNELAVLHRRLEIDAPYTEKFKARFKGVDLEKVLHITRPYYEKMRKEDMALDARIKRLIEQDNPEYAARMKAEEEKKQEVADLLRYIKRKDKPNVKQRIETMEKRYARLAELLGEEAKVYRPIVDAAIEDYEKNYKKAAKATAKKTTKQETKKTTKK